MDLNEYWSLHFSPGVSFSTFMNESKSYVKDPFFSDEDGRRPGTQWYGSSYRFVPVRRMSGDLFTEIPRSVES